MKITICGPAAALESGTETEITQPDRLKSFHGLKSSESCVDYIDDESLGDIGLIGGFLVFIYDEESQQLRILTEYHSPRKLKRRELDRLVEQTRAQWSDGIGEGEFTGDGYDPEVLLDASPFQADSDDLQVEQFDDGVKVPRPRKSPLFNATKNNDTAKLAKLLDAGEDINARDRLKNTPLHIAIYEKSTEAALLLVERGADAGVCNKNGICPMVSVAMFGRVEIMAAMLKAGADPDYCNPDEYTKNTPLIMACNRGQAAAVRLLVEYGAEVNFRNKSGYTPILHLKAENVEIAKFLVDNGADVDVINEFGKGMNEELKQAIS